MGSMKKSSPKKVKKTTPPPKKQKKSPSPSRSSKTKSGMKKTPMKRRGSVESEEAKDSESEIAIPMKKSEMKGRKKGGSESPGRSPKAMKVSKGQSKAQSKAKILNEKVDSILTVLRDSWTDSYEVVEMLCDTFELSAQVVSEERHPFSVHVIKTVEAEIQALVSRSKGREAEAQGNLQAAEKQVAEMEQSAVALGQRIEGKEAELHSKTEEVDGLMENVDTKEKALRAAEDERAAFQKEAGSLNKDKSFVDEKLQAFFTLKDNQPANMKDRKKLLAVLMPLLKKADCDSSLISASQGALTQDASSRTSFPLAAIAEMETQFNAYASEIERKFSSLVPEDQRTSELVEVAKQYLVHARVLHDAEEAIQTSISEQKDDLENELKNLKKDLKKFVSEEIGSIVSKGGKGKAKGKLQLLHEARNEREEAEKVLDDLIFIRDRSNIEKEEIEGQDLADDLADEDAGNNEEEDVEVELDEE